MSLGACFCCKRVPRRLFRECIMLTVECVTLFRQHCSYRKQREGRPMYPSPRHWRSGIDRNGQRETNGLAGWGGGIAAMPEG